MKKMILAWLLLCTMLSFAQRETDTVWKSQVNQVFKGLDLRRVPHGILLDYAMEFTNVPAYNGILSDSTFVDADVMGNIYKTLWMGKTTEDVTDLPSIEEAAGNWVKHRNRYNADAKTTLVLAGLYYRYSKIKASALDERRINCDGMHYADSFIDSIWQNPYESGHTIAFAPPVNKYDKKNFTVVLPGEMFLSNSKNTILEIAVDFSDGKGFRKMPYGEAIEVSYPADGLYNWIFRIEVAGGATLYSRTAVSIAVPVVDVAQSAYANNIFIPGPGSTIPVFNKGAILRIDYATSHSGKIMKPFIVAEGFDAGSILKPEIDGGDRTLINSNGFGFLNDLNNSGDLRELLLFNDTQVYDIIYIDWQNGTNSIQHNSAVLRNVLAWVNNQKALNFSTEKNVLLGQSMGGVIGRYCLAKMERDEVVHDVELFIAHDAPLQGANTPLSLQFFSRHIYELYTDSPASIVVETAIPTILNFLELMSLNTLDINFPSLEDVLTIQDTPAAIQMNYHYADIGNQATLAPHLYWQTEFDAMGYPQLCRNIAISNGNECASDHGFAPRDKFLSLDDEHNPGIFGDFIHYFATPVIGILSDDIELAILGLLPGSSKYFFDFDLYSTPEIGGQNRKIYFGKIRYEKRLLWILPPISHTITEKERFAPVNFLPFDTFSGGFYNVDNVAQELPFSIDLINPLYGFIPVVSSLDIRRNGGSVSPGDYLRQYAGGTTPDPLLSTEFANFIVGHQNTGNPNFNEPHISFQVRNGNWLAQEMEQVSQSTPQFPVADCSKFCSDSAITGPEFICGASAYSVTNEATTVNWSLSEGIGLVGTAVVNNQFILTPLSSSYFGYVTIQVTFGNERCGPTNANYRVWLGKPNVVAHTIVGGTDNVSVNAVNHFNVAAVDGAAQYNWFFNIISTDCGASGGLFPPGTVLPRFQTPAGYASTLSTSSPHATVVWSNCRGTYVVNCRAVNDCGLSDIGHKLVNVYDSSAGGNDPCEPVLEVYPNPVTMGNLSIMLRPAPTGPCDNNDPTAPIDNIVKIYDLYGNIVYSQTHHTDTISVTGLNLLTGHYALNVITSKGYIKREIIIIE